MLPVKFTVYILYSASIDRFYIGFTGGDIISRIKKHNANHKGFTGKRADWVLRYTEVFKTKIEAMKREREIKGWKSRQKILLLISVK